MTRLAIFDQDANAAGRSLISKAESEVALCVVPTDEELMIAVLGGRPDQHDDADLRIEDRASSLP